MSTIAPDKLFVIACPVCRGHIAASGGLCGRDACCPMCASLFHVPILTLAGHVVSPPPPPRGAAEDWGNVIETLAPPAPPVVPPAEVEHPSDFEIPPEAGDLEVAPATVVDPDTSPPPMANADVTATAPTEIDTLVTDGMTPPSANWIDDVLATSSPEDPAEAHAPPEGVPYLGPTLLAPQDQDLEFREPVRTVRHGDTVIEIRRLTPEERRARRFRRNLMMIVIGVSILMAIVVIFGVPTKPAR